MNEIEKLYENAKIYDFRYDCDVSFTDGYFGRITNCSKGEVKDYCIDKKYFKSAKVINYKHLYPPFTAEKMISLIIFLSYEYGHGLLINLRAVDKDMDIYDFELFGECLARLVNELWQDLTEEEKEQIRSVLNG